MKLFQSDFWTQKELAFQHTHMFYAFWIAYILISITGDERCAYAGLLAGIIVELWQWYGGAEDYLKRKWLDILRDLFFWYLGGMLNYPALWMR